MKNRKGTSKEIKELAKHIVPVLRDGGVIEASVFGSFTRGEAQPDSDLDLLVRHKETVPTLLSAPLKSRMQSLGVLRESEKPQIGFRMNLEPNTL